MKRATIYLFLIAALCSCNTKLIAQRILEKANQSFAKKNYYTAITQYNDALLKVKDSSKIKTISFKIAECYRFGNYPVEARKWYLKAIEEGYQDSTIFFSLGNAAFNSGDYETARNYFFKQLEIDSSSQITKEKLASIEFAQTQLNTAPKFEVFNESILNSKFSEFGLYYLNNRLIYASARYDEKNPKVQYKYTGQGFSDFYEAEYAPNQQTWFDPKKMEGGINSKFNDGTFCYDEKNNIAYFMQCNGYSGKARNCNIYCASFIAAENKWSKATLFEYNSKTYSIGHPAISADGNTLFFASDMPGGFGKTDIWMIQKDADSKWGAPINLGNEINTSDNEMFPYLYSDTLFYFASNGHTGLGGLDMYVSTYSNSLFSKPTNLGIPFNTHSDDFGIIIASPDSGMFCSNRMGGVGNDDIYTFRKIPLPMKALGIVVEKFTNKQIDSAMVIMEGSDGSIDSTYSTPEGSYQFLSLNKNVDYTVKATKSGYMIDTKSFSTALETENRTYSKTTGYNIDLELLRIDTQQVVKNDTTLEEITIPDIFYDFDKWSLRDTSKYSLDKVIAMLNMNPKINIRINSHTDSRGKDDYNLALSENRAQSVVNYLIEHNIKPSRLTFKGWGKTKLMVVDAKTEEEHQLNRRTTFSITNSEFLNSTDKKAELKKIEEFMKQKTSTPKAKKTIAPVIAKMPILTQPRADSIVDFRIQFSAATNPLEPKEYNAIEIEIPEFKVEYTKQSDGFYKYTIGSFTVIDQAKEFLTRVKKIKPDSFIVAYKGNKRITIEEAIKLLQK